jgi:hypothetical protein
MNGRESIEHLESLESTWAIDEVMEIASALAGHDAIGSIHIATNQRPTYAQLLRYRRRATAAGLELVLTRSSVILRPPTEVTDDVEQTPLAALRVWVHRTLIRTWRQGRIPKPAVVTAEEDRPDDGLPAMLPGGTQPARSSLPSHLKAWYADQCAMSEGTR